MPAIRPGPAVLALVFAAACAEPAPPPFDPAPYLERGLAATAASFQVMSGQLQGKLAEGGVPAAIDYCSLAAYPLTDSLSAAYGVRMRRAAVRFRNPANRADSLESLAIARFADLLAAGEAPKPEVHRLDDGSVAWYGPIVTLEPCTKCHGTVGDDLSEADYALISERYPEDLAVGFKAGDLRGIWSLRFDR